MEPAVFFDALMMICFGAAWPVAIFKTVRTKRVVGKSLLFLFFVLIGYLSGIAYKFLQASAPGASLSWVVLLYSLNASMVTIEIFLWFHYRDRPARSGQAKNAGDAVQLEIDSPAVEARKHRQ